MDINKRNLKGRDNREDLSERYFWPAIIAATVVLAAFLGIVSASSGNRGPEKSSTTPSGSVTAPSKMAVDSSLEQHPAKSAVGVPPPQEPEEENYSATDRSQEYSFGVKTTSSAANLRRSAPTSSVAPDYKTPTTDTYDRAKATSTVMGTYGPRGPPPVNGVAENGSRYGDTSQINGRPKTVAVQGYYRRDGTYVRGHYRSR